MPSSPTRRPPATAAVFQFRRAQAGEVRRTGIVVETTSQMNEAPSGATSSGVWTEYAAPTGLKIILACGSTNMPRLAALGTGGKIPKGLVGRAIPCPPPVANGRILVHEDGAHGVTRPTTARSRKQPPGRARSPAMSQLVAVRQHRPMAVCGGRTGQWARRGISQRDFINQPGVDAQRLRRVMIVK